MRRWLGLLLAAHLCACAQELVVRVAADRILVSAPGLHFLEGKPLERIKNGASVAYDFQLSLFAESRLSPLNRVLERFALSYDLWEEKFAATQLTSRRERGSRNSLSHLTAAAAEAWCVDNLSLARDGLAADRSVYVRLEVRADEPRDQPAIVSEPGINLTGLIEIFSRPARAQQPRWTLDSKPFRLDQLKSR